MMNRTNKLIVTVLTAMLLVSMTLAVTALVQPAPVTAAGPKPFCVPYPVEQCSTSCGTMCWCGGCCGGDPYNCKCDKIAFKKRCDDYCPGSGCISGWYCTSNTCPTDSCCP